MLILVAVTVTIAINGGLFNYAGKARNDTLKAMALEEVQVAVADYKMESITNGEESIVFGDFMNAMLTDNITAFVETDTTWEFNYKGFGFVISKDDLSINSGEATKIYKLIESESELTKDEEYLIASGKYADVYVLDKYIEGDEVQEGEDEKGKQGPRRDAAKYKVSSNSSIYYKGDYALKLSEYNNGWTLYDSKNKKYLTNSYSEVTIGKGNILDITNKKEEFSIEFGADGEAIIKAESKKNISAAVGSQKKFFTCYAEATQGASPVYLYKYIGVTEPQVLFTPTVNVNIESNKVTLFWNPIAHAKNYTVKWDDEDIVTTETICVFDELMNGSEHKFQVRANKDVADNTYENSKFTEEQIVIPSSGEYKLVETGEELVSEARYLICISNDTNNNSTYIMGAHNKNSKGNWAANRTYSEVSIVNNIIKHNGEYAIKLEKNGDVWKIKDIANSQYINSASNAKINLGNYNENNNAYNFSINLQNGYAIITSNAVTGLSLKYNSQAKIFSFYTSNQQLVYLYKETDSTQSTEPTGPIQLANPVVVATAEGKHVTLTWENSPNAASYTVIWNGDEEHPAQNITTGSWSTDVVAEGIYSYKVMAVGDGSTYESSNYTEGTINVVETAQYKLVSSIDDLVVGADYLIATKSSTRYALGSPGDDIASSSKRNADEVTIINNIINYNGFYPLTLLEWNENDLTEEDDTDLLDTSTNTYYKFYDARSSGYLQGAYNNDKFDNRLFTKSVLNQFSYFTIDIGTGGVATITNTNGGKLKANISNNSPTIFRCYTSEQTDVYLFKKLYSVGDKVKIKGTNEEFYVISSNGTNLTLLSALNVDPSTNKQTSTYKPVAYDNTEPYSNKYSESTIKSSVEDYVDYLESFDVTVQEGRLMKENELISLGANSGSGSVYDCPSFIKAYDFWIENSHPESSTYAWKVDSVEYGGIDPENLSSLRPVIVISKQYVQY